MNQLKNEIIKFILNTNIGFKLLRDRFDNVIIMYHGVTEKSCLSNKRHSLKNDFIKHLIFLKRFTNIVTLDQFFKKEFKKNCLNVAITFDDGYLNNYSIAKPILEKHNIPATFFITGINQTEQIFLWADFIDFLGVSTLNEIELKGLIFHKRNNTFITNENIDIYHFIKNVDANYETKLELYDSIPYTYYDCFLNSDPQFWKLMSDEDIKATSKSKVISIQSHGFFHNNLGTISHKNAMDEINSSKNYLENLTQKKIDTIGFPDGSYTREILDDSINLGITKFLAAEGYKYTEDNIDLRILDRKGIYDVGSYQNQLFNVLKA